MKIPNQSSSPALLWFYFPHSFLPKSIALLCRGLRDPESKVRNSRILPGPTKEPRRTGSRATAERCADANLSGTASLVSADFTCAAISTRGAVV
jgi:hypothetical protein